MLRSMFICGLVSVICGCSSIQKLNQMMPWYTANNLKSLAVQVSPGADIRFALSIDLVFIFDEKAQRSIETLTAQQWFETKPQLLSTLANKVKIVTVQAIQGTPYLDIPFPADHSDAVAVIAFANYPPNPNTKVVLTDLKEPWLIFDNGQLSASTSQ